MWGSHAAILWPAWQSTDHGSGRSSLGAQQAGFAERTGQKIVGQRQLADLGVQRLHVDGRRSRWRLRTEHPGGPLQELSLPGRNLVGMNIELLGPFGQRFLT